MIQRYLLVQMINSKATRLNAIICGLKANRLWWKERLHLDEKSPKDSQPN